MEVKCAQAGAIDETGTTSVTRPTRPLRSSRGMRYREAPREIGKSAGEGIQFLHQTHVRFFTESAIKRYRPPFTFRQGLLGIPEKRPHAGAGGDQNDAFGIALDFPLNRRMEGAMKENLIADRQLGKVRRHPSSGNDAIEMLELPALGVAAAHRVGVTQKAAIRFQSETQHVPGFKAGFEFVRRLQRDPHASVCNSPVVEHP